MKIEKNTKINYITILEEDCFVGSDNKKYNLCRCECGNIKPILNYTLKSGRIRDCGCGKYMLDRYINKQFKNLYVFETYRKRLGANQRVNIICKCKCRCGNIVEIPASKLKNTPDMSCGCTRKFDFSKYKNKVYNEIKILELINAEKCIVKCLCKCGNIFEANLYDITSLCNPIVGCNKCPEFTGNLGKKFIKKYKEKRDRLKGIYHKMIDRCYNPNAKDYKWYGAKGITVCDEWYSNIENFLTWAKTNGYQKNLSIDRINCDLNYSPENCRWTTMQEQQNNRSNNVFYQVYDELLTIPQIARRYNLNENTLRSRIRKNQDVYSAIFTPIKNRG